MIYSRKLLYDYVMDWLNKWDFPLYLFLLAIQTNWIYDYDLDN